MKIKFNKFYIIIFIQLLIQIIFLILGINFKSNYNSNIIPSNILGMITKIQTTNNMKNFIWCFSNNLTVLFINFWLNYWTYGILGTIWCANSAFLFGYMIKISLMIKSWTSVIFVILEIFASSIMLFSSTYFRFKKSFSKLTIDDKKYEKKRDEKNILSYMIIICIILLIAASLETFVLSSMTSV